MSLSIFKEKIDSQTLRIGVIGLGYVGLPLCVEFAKAGALVTGFDIDPKKIESLKSGISYIQDVPSDAVSSLVTNKRFTATTDFKELREMNAISICVPTPLGKTKDPDMSYIHSAVESIKAHLQKGQLIVLESTTYPGTTDEVILPLLEESGLKAGTDFYLAFSPERVDPGNPTYHTKNTPKVLGGITPECTAIGEAVYNLAIDTIVKVSSPKAAEMVKLLENTFRSVNIGLANEIVLMCNKLGINAWEVIEAAATKPFGFMPFFPGPGLGGHCIPIDPLYLSWKLKTLNYEARFIGLASEINESMPRYVVQKTMLGLNHHKKSVNGASVLIVGAAYKANIDDVRESPALEIMEHLLELGASVSYHDDFAKQIQLKTTTLTSVPLTTETLSKADCVVIVTHHRYLEIPTIVANAKLVIDTRNATKNCKADHVIDI
ncbi:MAG: nucleotide sugar dehydrogenase [Candidatus Margulisiibacteriota bacterium]